MRAQQRGVQHVNDAQAVAVNLVFIGGADAAAGGSDLGAAGRSLCRELNHAVVGEDNLRAVGQEKLAVDGQAHALEHADFAEQGRGVDDDAITDDALAAGAENAARDEVQDKFSAVDDDGVAGVVAASVAGDDLVALGQDIDDLAFAFIAPLGAKDDGCLLSGHVLRSPGNVAGLQVAAYGNRSAKQPAAVLNLTSVSLLLRYSATNLLCPAVFQGAALAGEAALRLWRQSSQRRSTRSGMPCFGRRLMAGSSAGSGLLPGRGVSFQSRAMRARQRVPSIQARPSAMH